MFTRSHNAGLPLQPFDVKEIKHHTGIGLVGIGLKAAPKYYTTQINETDKREGNNKKITDQWPAHEYPRLNG